MSHKVSHLYYFPWVTFTACRTSISCKADMKVDSMCPFDSESLPDVESKFDHWGKYSARTSKRLLFSASSFSILKTTQMGLSEVSFGFRRSRNRILTRIVRTPSYFGLAPVYIIGVDF